MKLICIWRPYTRSRARNYGSRCAHSSAEGDDKSAASADGVDLAGVIRVVHGTGAAAVVARGGVAAEGGLDGHGHVVAHDHRDVVPVLAAGVEVELGQRLPAPARLEVAATALAHLAALAAAKVAHDPRSLAIACPHDLNVAAAVVAENDPRSQRGLDQEHKDHHEGNEEGRAAHCWGGAVRGVPM